MDFRELLTEPYRTELIHELPSETYRSEPGVNPSWLVHMAKSPKHFLHAAATECPQTSATLIGTAVHGLVFEPDRFEDLFCVYGKTRNPRHDDYAAFLETEANGRKVLSPAECDAAIEVAQAVKTDPIAGPLLSDMEAELSIFAELGGVQCKGRADAIGSGYLLDLKTTSDVRMEPFGRAFANLSYALKLAMYRELLHEVGVQVSNVVIVAVEQKPPYDVTCIPIPDVVLSNGLEKAYRLLARFNECETSGRWPGVANDQWYELHIPNWSMPEDEMLEVFDG